MAALMPKMGQRRAGWDAALRIAGVREIVPDYCDALSEACVRAGGVRGVEGALAAITRMAGPIGSVEPDGVRQRREKKGDHDILLPGLAGPVERPAWSHFEADQVIGVADICVVTVTTPDRTRTRVRIGEMMLPSRGVEDLVFCVGGRGEVLKWIYSQRGPQATRVDSNCIREYYRVHGRDCGAA